MSFCGPLTFGDAVCLTSCHVRFVSTSCHCSAGASRGPPTYSPCWSARRARKEAIASRDGGEGGGTSASLIDELLASEYICARISLSENGFSRQLMDNRHYPSKLVFPYGPLGSVSSSGSQGSMGATLDEATRGDPIRSIASRAVIVWRRCGAPLSNRPLHFPAEARFKAPIRFRIRYSRHRRLAVLT